LTFAPHLARTHPEGRTAFNDHLATLREIVGTPADPST
jgi:hypothetical protein